ncbi:MAG: lactate utilization protein C [Veillonella sp.]|mgnify:FL=1|jgi:L-lactate dehydrogenase complex protein LldG|uniref:LutC/YkgG family protein n=1 Tax=Veillonella sp. TaxID=1926307 RepID=UPI001B3F88A7|nr:lactate utilization protein C [Veillonella sp.]NCB95205.1 lactate utilization protein C [Negativicutes bacterium]MBK7920969.1 lactate utilization protein C [Veillonella sp.]MBP6922760.1 lactate utilization protein C [Veillonella sp.]MBP8617298.1 lactate utilization protein C [Veillonella sp.]MBP9516723.1 lactate utilization protein C [Veillonella sp.]
MDAAKRNEFIGRLSRALGRDNGACPTSVPDFDYSKGPQETMYSDLSRDQIITMFKEECDRNGTKYVNTTPDKLAETVIKTIEDWGNGQVIYPNVPEVEQYGLDKAFAADKSDARSYVQWDASKGREANIMAAQDSAVGITFAIGGLAETASIVQPSTIDSGRAISLLPNTHIAILKTDSIMPRTTQAFEMLGAMQKEDPANFPANVVLISGPSNTADIELIRVNGAHGPLQVTYILVD